MQKKVFLAFYPTHLVNVLGRMIGREDRCRKLYNDITFL